MYGRSIIDNQEQRHYYLNNRKGLYPGYLQPGTTKIILTESIINATTFLKHTGHSVLALYGTNGLNQEHLADLQSLKTLNEVIFFFDGDDAGKESTKKYSTQLHQQFPNITISQVNTPKNEDINSLVQGHEPVLLFNLIETRSNIFSFLTENSIEKVECLDTPLQKITHSTLNTSQPEYITWQKGNLLISLGSSGTGKTYLQEKIAQLMPEEDKLEITTLSENALYYFERQELKNKLVLIEDLDGAKDDKILYAIRELMSKKKSAKLFPLKTAKGTSKPSPYK